MRSSTLISAALVVLVAGAIAPARAAAPTATCAATLAGELAASGRAGQLITVMAQLPSSSTGTVELWRRVGGCWRGAGGPWQAWLGADGVTSDHREGDEATPEGAFGIGPVMYGVRANPGVAYRFHRLVCGDWWDEQPGTRDYNRFVQLRCTARPSFAGASEALWRSPEAYAYFALIDFNTDPVVQGAGSAIFLHRSFGAPTHGCVALAGPELLRVLRWLRPDLSPLIVIGTAATIRGM